jgi:hypothetical protein
MTTAGLFALTVFFDHVIHSSVFVATENQTWRFKAIDRLCVSSEPWEAFLDFLRASGE